MNLNTLQLAGLSREEANAYVDLLKYGDSQTGKLCERTSIPSSHIYKVLNSLLEKGLVSFKLINNIKVYNAAKADALMQLFLEKERNMKEEKERIMESISQLSVLSSPLERLTDFKYFYGIRGIKSLYTEIIHAWRKGDEYVIAAAPLASFKKLEGFFLDEVHKKRVKGKIKLRIIISENSKKWGLKRKKMPFTEVKYLRMNTTTEYGVLNDYLFLVSYGKEPYALLIKDKAFADTYKQFFELLWKSAKRI